MVQNKFKVRVALVSLIFFTTSYTQEVSSSSAEGSGAGSETSQAGKKIRGGAPYATPPSAVKTQIMSFLSSKDAAATSRTSRDQNYVVNVERGLRLKRAQGLLCPTLYQAEILTNASIAGKKKGHAILSSLRLGISESIKVGEHSWYVTNVLVNVQGTDTTLDSFLSNNKLYPLIPIGEGVTDGRGRVCEYRAAVEAPSQIIRLTIQSMY